MDMKQLGSGDRVYHFYAYILSACFLKGDERMVNQEQEVLELVDNDRVNTEPLNDAMFSVGSFDASILGGKDEGFVIATICTHAHASTGPTFLTPVHDPVPY